MIFRLGVPVAVVLVFLAVAAPVAGRRVERTPLQQAKTTFLNQDGTRAIYQVEVAWTPEERDFGLMFRERLDAGAGMVFVFPDEQPRSFWMKNTYIPLDMVFVSAAGIVVGIVQNAAPLTLDERKCDTPARFVVELNAFETLKRGIKLGSLVVFDPPLVSKEPPPKPVSR